MFFLMDEIPVETVKLQNVGKPKKKQGNKDGRHLNNKRKG
jgi:hypothetical protein